MHRPCLGTYKCVQAGTAWVAGQLVAASAGRRRSQAAALAAKAEHHRAHQLPVLAQGSSGGGRSGQTRTNRAGSSGNGSSKTRKQVPQADPQRWQQRYTTKLGPVILALAVTGASLGPWLDGIHSRVGLIVYDRLPLTIGSLHTSLTVPILLSAFYAVLGSAFAFFDYRMAANGDATTQEALGRSSLTQLALCFGAIAATLTLSSLMYEHHTGVTDISLVLMAASAGIYLVFDGTKQGLALALLCALGAPLCELGLMGGLQLWHYPEGNIFTSVNGGIVSWTCWCYFSYTFGIANLSRYLMRVM